ncbi:hypothetical protein J6590_040758 [Homalodisca vitripennis]|nr:hypothetical protein J6590_040758 [Homalodisca vitripennis]
MERKYNPSEIPLLHANELKSPTDKLYGPNTTTTNEGSVSNQYFYEHGDIWLFSPIPEWKTLIGIQRSCQCNEYYRPDTTVYNTS